jgi:hypothetical protein
VLDLTILQAARLKGRLSPDAATAFARAPESDVVAELSQLRDNGYVTGEPNVRITPAGRERLVAMVVEERSTVDQDALAACYHDFDDYNTDLKSIITDWQLVDATTPNDHTDAAYDQRVIARLTELHERFLPLVTRVSEIAPRLAPYRNRFGDAILKVNEGDSAFVARPIADSYHTVWFEFHEELIGLLGLSREEEAAAGRAV